MSPTAPPDAASLLEHAEFVRAMARGVLGADDRVEDVVQDTFVAALSREKPPSRLRSWLASVGRRRAWDVRRRDAVRRRHDPAARGDGRNETPAVDAVVERAETTRRLVNAVLALEEPYREAILLRYWESLAPRDIAARLAAPVETVRTRLRRGLSRLRERLDDEHGGGAHGRSVWATALASWAGLGAAVPATTIEATSSVAGDAVAASSARAVAIAVGAGVVAAAGVAAFFLLRSPNETDGPTSNPGGEIAGDERTGMSSPAGLAAAGSSDRLAARPADAAGDPLSARGDDAKPGAAAASPAPTFTVRGRVTDAHGAPVAAFPVRYSLTPADKRVAHPSPDEAYTDPDGRYAIGGLLAGSLWMSLLPERGFPPSHERTLDLRADATQDFVVSGTIVLAGEVVASASAVVDLWLDYREEFAGGGWGNVWAVRKTQLQPGPRSFRLTALQPGVYTLHAETPGAAKVEQTLSLYADKTDLSIVMKPAQRVVGQVTVKPPLDPKGSHVWLRAKDGSRQESIDCGEDGTFTIDGMPDGRYALLVRNTTSTAPDAPDYHAKHTERAFDVALPNEGGRIDVTIVPDEEVGLWVRPPAGVAKVSGSVEVLDGPGWPDSREGFHSVHSDAGGGRLTMLAAATGAPWPPIRTTRQDGALLVNGLPKGKFRLRVTAAGFVPVVREVAVDGPTTVDVLLEAARGRVVRAAIGDEFWEVTARLADGHSEWKRILWQDGRVHISHRATPGEFTATLEPGEYEFRAISDRHAPTTLGPLHVEAGEEPLVLRFPVVAGAALSGTLRSRTGLAATLILHVFRREDDGSYRRLDEKTTGAAKGPYRIEGLARGHYQISTSEDGEPVVGEVDVEDGDRVLDLALPQ